MQDSSTSAAEAGGGYAMRRGHGPHLSISDPSHHVTEAIGHMYDDDEYDKRDSKRLSYISSPLSESITTIPPNLAESASPTSPQSLQLQSHLNEVNNQQTRPPLVARKSFDRDSSPGSPGSSKTDTATTSFPLNDVDYESNPAAVAQELNNLAAIRRMSMDAVATSDPDLPDFSSSIAASPSADENDASRLFWVPARLHPELAPMEFRSFLESKSERIKRRSVDYASLSPEGPGSGGGLRRKRSMLSREIDNSHGYTDGAERLERKRSQSKSKQDPLSPNLLELESLVDDSKQSHKPSSSLDGMQGLSISADEDKPILPPMPQAPGLRRSTRTQYRKAGSMKKGDRPRRFAKSSESDQSVPSIITSPVDQPILGLTRVSTDPTPSATRAQANSKSPPTTPTQEPAFNSSSTPATASSLPPPESNAQTQAHATESGKGSSLPPQSRQGQSRVKSNGRSSPERKVSAGGETPPANKNRASSQTSQRKSSGRGSESSSSLLPRKSSALSRQHKDNSSTLNEFANSPQALPGNTTRTDSLSFIPTFSEDRKSESKTESKKSRERKYSEGGSRKSSWHWLLGTEEKDKDKEKKKDKDSDAKRIKSKFVDKVHDSTNSHDDSSSQPRRESFAMDRPDLKLDEERKKDNARRTSGESKKEKESSIFSSIFGGGRKKHNSGDSHYKKSLSRNFSPDPPVRELQPDVDYPWTRFPILEERAIYRMAHIKLANPRRALHSQVLLSNFMYSYLAKVQQMHPHMTLVTSAAQRQRQQARDQQEEHLQYQRYQESQQYGDGYEESQMYDYGDDSHGHYGSQSSGYQNGDGYGSGYYNHYGHSAFGDDVQLDDDDDDNDMW